LHRQSFSSKRILSNGPRSLAAISLTYQFGEGSFTLTIAQGSRRLEIASLPGTHFDIPGDFLGQDCIATTNFVANNSDVPSFFISASIFQRKKF